MAYPPTVIPFPVKGIDQSQPFANQGDLTCPAALNARSFAVKTGRNHGGRRAGTRKLFNQQAGSGSDRRINHVNVVPRTVILAESTAGKNVPFADNLITPNYPMGLNNALTYDLLGNYVVFRKRDSAAWVLDADTYRAGFNSNGSYPLGWLELLTAAGGTATGNTGLAIAYPTTNDVAAHILADNACTATLGADYQVDGVGPFIRGSNDLKEKVTAYLEYTGQQHTVRLVMDQLTPTGRTRIKTSAKEFTMSGRAGLNTSSIVNDPLCIIRLTATPTTITASVFWPNAAPGGVIDTITLTHTAGQYYSANNRGGVMLQGNVTAAIRRAMRRMEYTRVEPYGWPVLTEMRAAVEPLQANRYVLPTGISSSVMAAAGIGNLPTVTSGPLNPAAAPAYPNVDTTNKKIIGSTGGIGQTVNTRTNIIATNATPAGTPFAIDLFYQNLSAGTDQVNPVFKLSSDHKYMIRVKIKRNIGAFPALYKSSAYTEIVVEAIYDNAGTRALQILDTFTIDTANAIGAPMWYFAHAVRWKLDGATITLSVNGMDVWTYTYTNSAAWTGAVASTSYGTYAGIDLGSQALGEPDSYGFRIVNLTPITIPTVAAGTDIVLYSTNQIDVGDPDNPTAGLTAATGSLPSGRDFQTAVLNNKIFLVDGTSTLEIDPIAKTSGPLVAEAGSYPAGCTLAAIYRGRLVLAAPANNRPFCAMSMVGRPANWDYGSLVTATKAVALTFADVGSPPDGITCLIPFSDDYMIFGCQGSIWQLIGDPGAGGSVQNVSYQTGILGPHAYCFTDTGALFFLGAGGLYIMNSGREYQAVGPRRVGSLIDRIDTSLITPRMIFDPVTQCIHIFLTPRDGTTLGRHVVYHASLDAFWIDEYPLAIGPHAVAQLKGTSAAAKRFVMGGTDGYLRVLDDDTLDDDGTPIDSWVQFPPIEIEEGHRDSMAKDLRASGLRGSAPVQWFWRVDDSPEQVAQQGLEVYRETGTWFADGNDGYQGAASVRETGAAHQLMLRQNIPAGETQGTWGLERVQVQMADMGGRNE
jgi:hypothetical protein